LSHDPPEVILICWIAAQKSISHYCQCIVTSGGWGNSLWVSRKALYM